MLVQKLPDDIVRLILKQVISNSWGGTRQWCKERRFLSICRQWRYLSLPFHYRWISLTFNNAPINSPLCKCKSADTQFGTCNKVKTNLDLFKASNVITYARVCTIMLGSGLHMRELIDDIRMIFGDTSGQWGCVEKIEFSLSKRFRSEERIDLNEVPKGLADQLAAVFTGVRMITSSCSKDNITGIAMINSLVDIYSGQLCRLAVDVPLLCRTLQFPQYLTHLTLDFEYNDIMQLPRIYISSLLYLNVSDVPVDLNWMDTFDRKAEYKDSLTFSNLKSLSISYSISAWRTGIENGQPDMHEIHSPPYRLLFPQLETLAIHMCPSRGGILQFSEFPQQGLKKFELGTTIYSDISLASVRRPIAVENLVINAAIMQTSNRRNPVFVYNSILGKFKTGACGTTAIVMSFGATLTEPLQVQWPSVTKLELFEPTPISMLLELVPRLPNLKRLTAHYLTVDIVYKVSSIAKDHNCCILSHSLRELCLDTYDTKHDGDFQKAVCYFMALAPKLSVVAVPEAIRPALRAFINKSEATYGHLKNVIL